MKLQIATRTVSGVSVVDCHGRIVLGEETAELRQVVKDFMRPSAHIVLNLTGVDHVDSNGIGMLFGLHVSAEKDGVVIKLAGLGGHVKSVAEITRLITYFDSYPTVEEAVASFGPAAHGQRAG